MRWLLRCSTMQHPCCPEQRHLHQTRCVRDLHSLGMQTQHVQRRGWALYDLLVLYNCKTAALARGLCGRHGGGRTKACSTEACKTLAQARGRCKRHGAYGWCKLDGCTTPAVQGFEHCTTRSGGKKRKPCPVSGCTTTSHLYPRVSVANMEAVQTNANAGSQAAPNAIYGFLKTCKTHGGSGYCEHPSGCITPALSYGANCKKHTPCKKYNRILSVIFTNNKTTTPWD